MVTKVDNLTLGDQLQFVDGALHVESCSVQDLAKRYGTPLHVFSRAQLTENYVRARAAFESHWPRRFILHYSMKANPAAAIRALLTLLGAGGDAMGLNELKATLRGGASANRVRLNGNNKEVESLELAVECGVRVNVDHPDELPVLRLASERYGRPARVALRVKPDLDEFGHRESELRRMKIREYAAGNKWGLDIGVCTELVPEILDAPQLELEGLHYHLGRQLGSVELFECLIPGIVRFIGDLQRRTGWAPDSLNLGGGLTQGRDPFGAAARQASWVTPLQRTAPTVEDYAKSITGSLMDGLAEDGIPLPELELECGRYLTSNSCISLARIGVIKRMGGRIWVNVDLGGNQIGLSRSPDDAHAVVPVLRGTPDQEHCDVVGPLCTLDNLAQGVDLPQPRTGDFVAFLDTGAYADGESSTSNLLPRPAVVLVDGRGADVIRSRETYEQVMGRDRIPEGLEPESTGVC